MRAGREPQAVRFPFLGVLALVPGAALGGFVVSPTATPVEIERGSVGGSSHSRGILECVLLLLFSCPRTRLEYFLFSLLSRVRPKIAQDSALSGADSGGTSTADDVAAPGGYRHGVFVSAARGSSIDVGLFHDDQRRSVATLEVWVNAGEKVGSYVSG